MLLHSHVQQVAQRLLHEPAKNEKYLQHQTTGLVSHICFHVFILCYFVLSFFPLSLSPLLTSHVHFMLYSHFISASSRILSLLYLNSSISFLFHSIYISSYTRLSHFLLSSQSRACLLFSLFVPSLLLHLSHIRHHNSIFMTHGV